MSGGMSLGARSRRGSEAVVFELERLRMGSLAGDLAALMTVAAVLVLFAASPLLLESLGIPYTTSAGGPLSKIHPASLLAVAALGLRCLTARRPLVTAWRLVTDDPGIIVFIASIGVVGFFAIAVTKSPVTPLIDTFLLPVLFFLLLRDLDPRAVKWIAILLGLLLCANAIIAMIEFKGGWRLMHIDIPEGVSADPTRPDAVFSWQSQFANEWRATAILGHPLVNGQITGAFILCLLARGTRWVPSWISIPVVLLQSVAMFAFGARASLLLTGLIGALLLALRATDAIGRGDRIQPKHIAIGLLSVGLLICAVAVLVNSGFLDKTIDRFYDDGGSASTRLTMFELIASVPLSDLILIPDPGLVLTLQRVYGLEFGIESSWIGLALAYGLIVTLIIMFGLWMFSASLVRTAGRGTAAVLIFYFVLASGAATLSVKTTTLATMTVLCLVFLRRDEGASFARAATTNRRS